MPDLNLSLSWTSRRSLNLRQHESLNTERIGQIACSGFLLLSILAAVIPNLSCFTCPDPSLRIKCLLLGNLWPDTMDVLLVCVTSQFFVHRYLYGSCATKRADMTEECQK